MNNDFLMQDTFTNRVVTLPGNNQSDGRVIIARLIGTLPIMIANDSFIQECKVTEAEDKTQEGPNNKLVDKAWSNDNNQANRLSLMGIAKSAMTNSRAYFYYDKKYQDIIILPNIDTISLAGNNIVFPLDGFRLGSGVGMKTTSLINTISMDESDRVKLPTGKANVPNMKCLYVTMPTGGTNRSVDSGMITIHVTNQYSCQESEGSLFTLVELGTKTELFDNPSSLPLYLFHQTSLIEHGIRYLGFKDPGNQKLYVKLAF